MADLDIYQQKPVEYEDSAVCIAGPGSGKTRVLSTKAEELTKQGNSVICLTFTRAAAQEIRDRIPGILAGTIHSFCNSVVGWEKTNEDLLTRYIRVGKLEWTKDEFNLWLKSEDQKDINPNSLDLENLGKSEAQSILQRLIKAEMELQKNGSKT